MEIKQKVKIIVKINYKIHLYLVMLISRFSLPLSIKYYEWFLDDVKNNIGKYIKYEVGH